MSTPLSLRVVAYNVWLMPPLVTWFANNIGGVDISPHKHTRAARIARELPVDDVDVVVLCEAFCDASVSILCEGLARRGLGYRTKTLGSAWTRLATGKFLSGGVVVLSRFPLEDVDEVWFGSTFARDDGFANKGCIRATVRKDGQAVHVFATHTQAWNEPNCIEARNAQLGIVRSFISDSATKGLVRPDDVVLVAGDLNVDRYAEEGAHYRRMLEILACDDPHLTDASEFSFNHLDNALAAEGPSSGGKCELLDYVLVSSQHRKPKIASGKVIKLTTSEPYDHRGKRLVDLSDHYPVKCDLEF